MGRCSTCERRLFRPVNWSGTDPVMCVYGVRCYCFLDSHRRGICTVIGTAVSSPRLSGRHSRDSVKIVKPILAFFHGACKHYKPTTEGRRRRKLRKSLLTECED